MAKQDMKLTPKVPVNSGASISLKNEGVPLLRDIVTRLTDKSPNVGDVARTALHVCNLMGWRDAAQWISQELNGYDPDAPAPRHRHVVARVRWRPYGLEALTSQVEWEVMRGATKGRPIPWIIRSSLDEVMRNAAGPDVAVHDSDEEERLAESDGRKVRGHDQTIIESTQYQQCLESLRNQLFSWASQSYSASRVGDLAGDTWSSFRRVVDEALVKLDMGDHLTAIETGLTSSNSQDWRLAMYGVRDVIRDLGNQLWLVADETYPYLDNDNGKPIRVTELE